MNRNTISFIIAAAFLSGMYFSIAAAGNGSPFVLQEQQSFARQLAGWKKDREASSRVPVIEKVLKEDLSKPTLPAASFFVREIRLENVPEELDFLQLEASSYENRDLDLPKIEKLVLRLNQKLQDRGYVTTQVTIPEQNISSGMIRLVCLPGKLRHVVYEEGSEKFPWRNAFPIREGEILNLRMLEEGVENIKRLRSLDISMKIIPVEAGLSDVELSFQSKKQVHGLLSLDDSGLTETGRMQLSGGLTFDRVTNANDSLQISGTLDISRDWSEKGTRSQSFIYSIPYGKDRWTISHRRNRYNQFVYANPYGFASSGKSQTTRLTYEHMISRSRTERKSLDVNIIKRDSHYFINDTEIPVQAMDTTALEIGLSDRIYIGNGTLYFRAAHKQGTGWFGAQDENAYPDAPKTRYYLWLFDMDWRKPFAMGHRPASFSSSFHGQWNTKGQRLYGIDMVSIGNRYTVMGFDGEYTLMGESGWYLRNELASVVPDLHSEIYMDLSIGSVYGISTDTLVGRTIAGGAIGLRGTFLSGLSYDAFISRAIYKPEGYHTRKWVPGFTVSCHF